MTLKILIILEALCGLAVACLAVPYIAEHRPKPKAKLEWVTSGPVQSRIGDSTPWMKQVAISVKEVRPAAGFVMPHSRVDVVSVVRGDDGEVSSETILENVLIVGGDKPPDDRNLVSDRVTLEVTPEEAERLALARKRGTFRLILRQSDDEAMSPSVTPR